MDIQNPQSTGLQKAPLIAGVSLVLGLLFNYFFFEKTPGIAFPIFIGLILVGLFIIASHLKKQINKQVFWLILPVVFFSGMVFVRSSPLLTFLNIVTCLFLLLLIGEMALGGQIKKFIIGDYVKTFFLPFKFIHPLFQTLPNIFKFRETNQGPKVSSRIIKGITMTIPVIFVFLLLFSSADLVFKKYISNLITINLEPETIPRLILVLCATFGFIGAYSYALNKKEDSLTEEVKKQPSVGHIETTILLGAVNVLFFAFILIQLTYLFGGEGNIVSKGLTYAEYARKGFFELITVAIISFLLLLTTEKYTAKKDTEHTLMFKLLSSALILQVILIMVSAYKRLLLYEEAYGLTTLRLYSHIFIFL